MLESPLRLEMLEELEPARTRRHRRPPRPDAQAARRRAPRATRGLSRCDDRVPALRRWPSGRCERSAHALRRYRRRGHHAVRRGRAADRRHRRQRVRQGRDLPRRQREPVAAPGRPVRGPRGVRTPRRPPAQRLARRRASRDRRPRRAGAGGRRGGSGILCRRGVTFVTAGDADLVALRRAVQPVYDWLERDAQTKAAIGEILRHEVAVPVTPGRSRLLRARAGGGHVRGGHAGRRRLPLGHHARAAQPHAGLRPGENDPSNVGHFRMELHDGRFRITGSSDGVDQEGNFSLDGDVLTFPSGTARQTSVQVEPVPRRADAAQDRRGTDDLRGAPLAEHRRRDRRRRPHADRRRLRPEDDARRGRKAGGRIAAGDGLRELRAVYGSPSAAACCATPRRARATAAGRRHLRRRRRHAHDERHRPRWQAPNGAAEKTGEVFTYRGAATATSSRSPPWRARSRRRTGAPGPAAGRRREVSVTGPGSRRRAGSRRRRALDGSDPPSASTRSASPRSPEPRPGSAPPTPSSETVSQSRRSSRSAVT